MSDNTCINYGTLVDGACDCPTGLGGTNCSTIVCENPIARPSNRSALVSSAGSTGCGGSGQCTSGFNGLDCNICQNSNACSTAIATYGAANTSSVPISSSTGLTGPDEMLCSNSPYTYTSSFVECNVINPTLQGVFPGTTYLKFQKNVRPTLSVSDAFGSANTTFAQLWYSPQETSFPQEQFYCSADSCSQRNDTSSSEVEWSCSNLKCTCIPGAAFCSDPLDLTTVINGLGGSLNIDCSNNGTSCSFKQETLNSLFGQNGLGLSGCTFGECVSSQVVQAFSEEAQGSDGSDDLSGGVIAGLAVVGALLLGVVLLFILGLLAQKKAKRGGTKHLEASEPAGLSWTNIGYKLPARTRLPGGASLRKRKASPIANDMDDSPEKVAYSETGASKSGKMILDNVSGSLPYGGFMAIMGPSGAGKSTLVDILAGKRKAGRIFGSVQLLTNNARGVRIGYVDQADVLPGNLTVRECLLFAAKLKLPESIPAHVKEERVWEVLGQLGLRDVANSRVGSSERRGISGGERRRLSIGLELIARPSVLILDEPTSGLDSVSASKVVRVLQELAKGEDGQRTTIIATIHQPSSQIFHAFDSILLLSSQGTQIYLGKAEGAAGHFAELGYPCPHDWNPADHLLEIASMPSGASFRSNSQEATTPFAKSEGLNGSNGDGFAMTSILPSEGSSHQRYPPHVAVQDHDSSGASATAIKQRNSKPIATYLTQFQLLSHREYLNLKRDWGLVIMHNAVAAVVGVFVGGLYYQVDTTISGFQNRIGSLFFLGALIAFSALSALNNLASIKSLFLRERASSFYSPIIWMLTRVVWDIIPLRILPTLILGLITYWMVGLSHNAAHFFKFLLILVEYSATITLFNLLLAVLVPESGLAILLSNVLNLGQLAFAGFFVNLSKIPPVLRWIQWLNPLKYALEALAVNEVSAGLMISDTLQGVPVQINAEPIMALLFGFKPNAYYRDVLVLFGWLGLFGICLILAVLRLRELR
ncbi:hypothetical protein P389DRAFT_158475 [Cystobasidium minutum MCA 4210]|uniref:uncharacterized protein n=1 Tax=Cystobasidium minutum MCA 4210 TaxID=1397322 RepID=UPI0034CE368C|eukprot:jgi/Rhomi1/158475/estExt_Genewise1Plus.C_2_t30203